MPKPAVDRAGVMNEDDGVDPNSLSFEQAAQAGYGTLTIPKMSKPSPFANGELITGGYKLTKTRLVLPLDITQEQWCEVGAMLVTAKSSVQWWIGDWLNRADREWGDADAAPLTFHRFASFVASVPNSLM